MKAWSLWEGGCTSSWVVFKMNIRSMVAGKKIAFMLHSLSSYPTPPRNTEYHPSFPAVVRSWKTWIVIKLLLNCSDAEVILFQICTNIQVWNWKLAFHPFRRAIQLLGGWKAFASPCSISITGFPEWIRSSSSRLPAIYKNLWHCWCPVSLMSFTNRTVF